MADPLPSFDRPPVVETVLGMQFDHVPGLTTGHLGLFWKHVSKEWTSVLETPPIGLMRGFVAEPSWSTASGATAAPALVRLPSMRLRLANATGDRLLQVENGWFVYNWRQQPQATQYPRFDAVRAAFDRELETFGAFMRDNAFPAPKPNLWEVAYVNLVPRGDLWSTPEDWRELLPGVLGAARPRSVDGLISGDARWVFGIGNGSGQLLVQFEHGALSGTANEETVVLRLIARGVVLSGSREELDSGLGLGHESIVKAFKDIVGVSAQKYWGARS